MKNPLITVRKINAAIWENVNNRGGYVYAEVPGVPEPVRVTRARCVKGELQIKTLGDGRWVVPFRVWQDEAIETKASRTRSSQVMCESCGRLVDSDGLKVHICPPLRVGEHFQKMMDSLLGEG